MVQLMQWNTNDYMQQFHILEHEQNMRETGAYACMHTENGQSQPGKDILRTAMECCESPHVSMQNFHDKWHCLSNKYKTLHNSIYIPHCATRATNSTQHTVHR